MSEEKTIRQGVRKIESLARAFRYRGESELFKYADNNPALLNGESEISDVLREKLVSALIDCTGSNCIDKNKGKDFNFGKQNFTIGEETLAKLKHIASQKYHIGASEEAKKLRVEVGRLIRRSDSKLLKEEGVSQVEIFGVKLDLGQEETQWASKLDRVKNSELSMQVESIGSSAISEGYFGRSKGATR